MKNNAKNAIMFYIITAAVFAAALFTGCGAVEPPAPSGLTGSSGDPDNPNRIELSWLPVDGADIYYVYRDTSASGDFTNNTGFSITSYTDASGTLRYSYREIIPEGEGGTYWYKVTAASNADATIESAKSAAEDASTYVGTWSAAEASVRFTTVAHLRLAASLTELYALAAPSVASTIISVKKYAEDDSSEADDPPMVWTDLASPGNIDDTAGGLAPMAAFVTGGELNLAFSDADADVSGTVTLRYYENTGTEDAPSWAWTTAGAPGFNAAEADHLAALPAGGFSGDIYTAFVEGAVPKMYLNNDEILLTTSVNPDVPATADAISLVSHNNEIYLGYEDKDGSGLYIREYDPAFKTLAEGPPVTASAIAAGNAVFVSGGGSLYAIYVTDAGDLEIKKLVDGSWIDLDDVAGDDEPATGTPYGRGTLAAHWFNGYLYVFYVDSSDDNGHVRYYSEDSGWQPAERNGGALTESGALSSFQLTSSGTVLYAGYIENGTAYVRVLE